MELFNPITLMEWMFVSPPLNSYGDAPTLNVIVFGDGASGVLRIGWHREGAVLVRRNQHPYKKRFQGAVLSQHAREGHVMTWGEAPGPNPTGTLISHL